MAENAKSLENFMKVLKIELPLSTTSVFIATGVELQPQSSNGVFRVYRGADNDVNASFKQVEFRQPLKDANATGGLLILDVNVDARLVTQQEVISELGEPFEIVPADPRQIENPLTYFGYLNRGGKASFGFSLANDKTGLHRVVIDFTGR